MGGSINNYFISGVIKLIDIVIINFIWCKRVVTFVDNLSIFILTLSVRDIAFLRLLSSKRQLLLKYLEMLHLTSLLKL